MPCVFETPVNLETHQVNLETHQVNLETHQVNLETHWVNLETHRVALETHAPFGGGLATRLLDESTVPAPGIHGHEPEAAAATRVVREFEFQVARVL